MFSVLNAFAAHDVVQNPTPLRVVTLTEQIFCVFQLIFHERLLQACPPSGRYRCLIVAAGLVGSDCSVRTVPSGHMYAHYREDLQILQLPNLVYNKASEVQRAARIQTNEKIQKILWGGKSNTRPACNHSSTHHTMGLIGMPPPFLDGGRPAVMCAGVREGFRSSPCSLGVEGLGVEGFRPAPRSLGVPKLYRKTEPNIDGQ